jgi:hypothetical protein
MKHRLFNTVISLILCAALLIGAVPMTFFADSGQREYTRLADLDEITGVYLSDSEERSAQYPNGAIMIVETAAEFAMEQTYAIDIFRQGGVAGEAKIKLSTVDMTAGYGEAYRLYLSDERTARPVEGEKKLYYYESGVPYIARLTDQETYYMTQDGVDDLDEAKKDASEINDIAAESMPHSTETILTFAEGENRKTILIETLKKDKVTDDLEFMLVLSEPENCSISANTSGMYTIKETREKPKAKLEIVSTSVNPESDEAFVSIVRSGNLGGYDSFRVTTQSDTAQAETDYIAVAEDLRFVPGVSEIKVPITLLDGAESGRSFGVELSDPSVNAVITADKATVTLDSSKEIVSTGAESKKYVTDFTYKSSNYREYEFVDLSKFHKEKCLGDWDDATNKYESNKWRLDYDQWGWKNHAVDAMSPSKISFVGVKSVRFCYDNASGSCEWDDAAVVLSEINPLDDGDRECDWMDSLGQNGTSWGMSNVSSSHLNKTITPTSGDKYIYLVLHKAGFTGCSGVKFHDYTGDKDCSFRLNLQDYNVRIIDPSPVTLYQNGKLETVRAVTNAQFTDPNTSSANYTTAATFYRYDTTTIKAAVDSKYGTATLKGIYICNPDDTSKHSSLITLSGGNFTFSPSIISNYSRYIVNNKLVIQPVYEFNKIDFSVESYTDDETGVTFTADNANHSGVFTIDGQKYGTVRWSYDSQRAGYYDGDELIFTFTPEGMGINKTVAYEYRYADVKSDLASAQWNKTGTAADEVKITLSHKYFSVSPYITDLTAKNRLIVKNPDGGDFTSKGTKYADANSDGSITVTGYYIKGDENVQTIDEEFVNYKPGMRMEYSASPKNGYFAVWTYTDAVTHQENTYRGNTFYYTVQNPFRFTDNTVTLTFCSSNTAQYKQLSAPLSGSIYVPSGSILHPATSSSDVRVPAANATVYLDGFTGVTDGNGQFILTDGPESDQPARIPVTGETSDTSSSSIKTYTVREMHRALIYYNGNYYICDVSLRGSESNLKSFGTEIVLDTSSTLGVIPKRAEAFSYDTGVYGDSITLVNARSVNFSVDFDARNISAAKPVNLARWSFESEDGMQRSSTDIPIVSGSSTASFSCVVTEKAKPGDHLYIEFFNKGYDSASNEQYTFYGRYEVGYTFVSANIEKVMSYMPDIGFYDEEAPAETGDLAGTGAHYSKIPSAPAIGPISPMVSIFGFTPTYSDAATGQKDQKTGKDLYCLEIGVQVSIKRTETADKSSGWSASSVASQWSKLADIISKEPGELIQNMQTSTKITVTISFAYQLEYYTSDSGQRCYTASVFLLGGYLGVRISVPFTIVAIPCFVYFDISADNVGYLVHMPNNRTEGYWTSEMLENSYYYDTHGEFSQKFKIQMGVGIGFDGLASIGGHIDFGLLSQISGTSHGKMTVSVAGGVFAQLLFFKVDQTWKIKEKVILDTDADLASVSANILNRQNYDLMANTKLSDLVLAEADDIYDPSVNKGKEIAATGSEGYALYTVERYAEGNTARVTPVIGKISDTRYLIATVMNTDSQKFTLRYYIYDTNTKEIVDQGSPVSEVIASNGLALDSEEVQDLLDCNDLVGDVNIIDCGEKLLLIWEGCTVKEYQNAAVDDALRSFKIAALVYDKKIGQFTDFDIVDTVSDTLPDQLKGVYNPATGKVHIFYESIDASTVDADTTMAQLNDLPLSLNACSMDLSADDPRFTAPVTLETRGITVTDYDVTTYDDDILVSYICAGQNSLTVENPLTAGEYDANSYGTKNHMYLNRYDDEGGSLKPLTSILIADENYVTANPEFTHLSYQGVENTLLFFKSNGRYGYQNIENLYIQYQHEGWDEIGALLDDAMQPDYITDDEDHTVGEDFKVYAGEDGVLYALWTLAEGSQQQIWGRQFSVDSVEEVSAVAATDNKKNVLFSSSNTPITEELDKPIHILHGFWGNKARLTTGGSKIVAPETGYYKGRFDAVVLDKEHILSAYSSFDYDFGEEEEGSVMRTINNRFIVSEFDITSYFHFFDDRGEDAVTVNNSLPTPGETVKITTLAINTGFSTARDVTLNLKAAGWGEEPLASVTYPVWLSGEEKVTEFEYTVPEDFDIANHDIDLYYDIIEDGERVFRSEITASLTCAPSLSIDIAHAEPQKLITDDNDSTYYRVTATVSNIGNAPYAGGDELTFIYNDMAAQADVMNPNVPDTDPFYINYGGITIPEIGIGSSVELSFVTDEIPERIFDKYGTNSANLKLAITPADGIGWTEVKGSEHYNFLDELGIGQFVKPEPKEIAAVSAQAIVVPLGSTRFILPTVTPLNAAADAEFTYSTTDKNITVDETGLVRGNRRGTAVVTVTCDGVSTQVPVTVEAPEAGDADGDGNITIVDATVIQRHLAGIETLSGEALKRADADRDGSVTILDATLIQRYLAAIVYSI